MEYAKKVRVSARCLHCGEKISYGRVDKKYCSEECRSSHHNSQNRRSSSYKRKILSQLSCNYEILDQLYSSGTTSMDMSDLVVAGFAPNVFTSLCQCRGHVEYACFDLKYRMTSARVFSISKIQNVSLYLQDGKKVKD